MFTGLVEAVGELIDRKASVDGARLQIGTRLAPDLRQGDSIAVNGVCLTVVQADARHMCADVGPETLRVTTLGTLSQGAPLNLERPLQIGSRLGGHFVQGHVDGVGRVDEIRQDGDSQRIGIEFPRHLAQYFVIKGSIAVDGISLTVASLTDSRFEVQAIPYTLENTNLKSLRLGSGVNLECDLVGKYIVRSVELAESFTRGLGSENAVRGSTA
jgi:riboflavin synthase